MNQAGAVSGFAPPGDIHRVRNSGDTVAISMHVYGADISRLGNSIRREYPSPSAPNSRRIRSSPSPAQPGALRLPSPPARREPSATVVRGSGPRSRNSRGRCHCRRRRPHRSSSVAARPAGAHDRGSNRQLSASMTQWSKPRHQGLGWPEATPEPAWRSPAAYRSPTAAMEADAAQGPRCRPPSGPGSCRHVREHTIKDLELRALPSDRHRYIVELTTRIEKRSRDF